MSTMSMMFSASYLSKLEAARSNLRSSMVADDRSQGRGGVVELAEVTQVCDLPSDHHPSPSPPTSSMAATQKSTSRAPQTYYWVTLWFVLTAPVIAWDVGYCLMRPLSMKGGSLHWIWSPYAIYQEIDYVYGLPSFNSGDGFTNAQSVMNIFETLLNLLYVYQAHVLQWPGATLTGFTAAALTLAKTVLYWAQEYFCGYCAVGHNNLKDLIVFWIIPNGLWLVFPSLIVYRLGKDLVRSLETAATVKTN